MKWERRMLRIQVMSLMETEILQEL